MYSLSDKVFWQRIFQCLTIHLHLIQKSISLLKVLLKYQVKNCAEERWLLPTVSSETQDQTSVAKWLKCVLYCSVSLSSYIWRQLRKTTEIVSTKSWWWAILSLGNNANVSLNNAHCFPLTSSFSISGWQPEKILKASMVCSLERHRVQIRGANSNVYRGQEYTGCQ